MLQEVENAEKLLRKPTKFEIMRRFKSKKTKRKSQIMHPSHLTEVRSGEFLVSPYYTNTMLSKQVMRTKEMIRWWIVLTNHQIFRASNNRNVKKAVRRSKILAKRVRKSRWGGGYSTNSYKGGGEGGAPPRGATPYPFVYLFDRKGTHFIYVLRTLHLFF